MENQKKTHSFWAFISLISVASFAFIFSVLSQSTQKPQKTNSFAAEISPVQTIKTADLRENRTESEITKEKIFLTNLQKVMPAKNPQAVLSNKISTAGNTQLPDLDVIYISRTPRYFRYCVQYINDVPQLCNGTENQKHWPDIGENVTYEAHVTAKGSQIAGTIGYEWDINGVKVSGGEMPSTTVDVNTDFPLSEYATPWKSDPEQIQFKAWIVSPQTTEQTLNNNQLTIGSQDLTLSYWVETAQYNEFNALINAAGSYSFEDWVQAHIAVLNKNLRTAVYPSLPNGVTYQVRLDKLIIADEMDGGDSPRARDPDFYTIDGRWQSTDSDPTNTNGQNGFWHEYAVHFAPIIDWGLIHELTHQLGAIDLYLMNYPEAPPNHGLQITDVNGNVITEDRFPLNGITFPNWDLMGGGDITPYTDHTMYSFHTAAGLQSNAGYRRGYFGEYLFDTPDNTSLKIVDSNGQPITNAKVDLFQRDPFTEIFDNTPEISGITDATGVINLPNREAPSVTTETKHTEKPNPFGKIYVSGAGAMMATRVIKDGQDGYAYLLLHDLNVAYWDGQKKQAIITLKTSFPPISPLPTPTSIMTPTLTPTLTPTPTLTLIPSPTLTPSLFPTTKPTNTPTLTPSPTKIVTPTKKPTPTKDMTGPIVTILSPRNGSSLSRNSSITLKATADDPSGISKVQFYVNNSLKCTDNSSSYTCKWSVPNKKGVIYTIKVTAYDKKNNTSTVSLYVTSK